MNKQIASIVLCFSLAASSNAADSGFQQWMQQQQNEFQEYKDERDKAFTAFLKNNWKEMQVLKGIKRDPKPKPVKIPVAKSKPPAVKQPSPEKPLSVKPDKIIKPVAIAPPPVKPKAPISTKPATSKKTPAYKGRRTNIMFMGEKIAIYYDSKLRINISSRINKKTISEAWSKLSKADYEPLIEQLNVVNKQKSLNDWAFAVLVNTVSEAISGNKKNSVSFLNWFLFIKANYEARIAYDDKNLHLLLPTKQALYSIPYFTFDGIRFYSVSFDGKKKRLGKVYTYDGRYPDATESLDMRLLSDMSDLKQTQTRKLNFTFKGKKYSINASYDQSRVEFLNTYPQLDLKMYYKSKLASSSAESLHGQLAVLIKGMSQQDAVNFLLRFVQTSLEYKTDDDQFGEENYLFPEETLHYKYSDCEDRSILFAWLVHNILSLEVVGLDYPGHVAAAVAFTTPVTGDNVRFNGKRYTVTDPTYINADAGMTMPQYKNTRPKVIRISL